MNIKIKIDNCTGLVTKVRTNVGRTRMNRAALALWRGEAEPTTSYKLRRFFRRLFAELRARAERAATEHIVGSQAACDVPFICAESHYE